MISKDLTKSFTWRGFFSCRSSSLLPNIKTILNIYRTQNMDKQLCQVHLQKKGGSGFWELLAVPARGIHKGLSYLLRSMNTHIPHKDTWTSIIQIKSNLFQTNFQLWMFFSNGIHSCNPGVEAFKGLLTEFFFITDGLMEEKARM